MMIAALTGILAEQGAGLRGARERFTTVDPSVGWQILSVAGLLAGLLLLGWLAMRWQRRRQTKSEKVNPMGLYLRLAAGLGLSFAERWRLWRMAKALALPDPAVVLISEAKYDAAVSTYCGGGGRSSLAGTFAQIRTRLFA